MYSYEIQQLLEFKQYLLSAKEYLKVCESPQIRRITYNPYSDTFYIETEDRYKWTFKVRSYKDE